jgi:hypothetical protein
VLAAGLPHAVATLSALLAADRIAAAGSRRLALALLVALAPAAAVFHGAHLGAPELRRFSSPLRLVADTPAPRIAHPVNGLYARRAPVDHLEIGARAASVLLRPAVNVAARVDTVEPYTGFEPGRLTALSVAFDRYWSRAFRRFGLTHVAIALPHDPADGALAAVATDGGALVQREPGSGFELWSVPHRPWAFFPSRAVAAASRERALGALLDLGERGEDGAVLVEASAPLPTSPGQVLRVERGTSKVRIEAEASGPALLVVQDAFWPGWRAWIDGRPAEILAADFLVRAVPWPAGRHVLVMTYDPPELRHGLALSAAGGVLVLLLAALAARGRRKAAAT